MTTAVQTLGALLEKQSASFQAQLKPFQDFMAAQGKKPEEGAKNILGTFPWQESLGQSIAKWASAPKPGEAILFRKDGSYQLVPATAVMAQGGLLAAIENPLNSFYPTIPVGSITVGAITGLVVGEVIDGLFAPKTTAGKTNLANVAVKAGGVIALATWGPKLMGRSGNLIAIGILGAQVIAD